MPKLGKGLTRPYADRLLTRRTVYKGKRLVVFRDRVVLGGTKQVAIREVVGNVAGAAMVAMTFNKSHVALIRQYRHAVGQHVFEIPAGQIEKDEYSGLTAIRELEEETGIPSQRCFELTKLGGVFTSPGFVGEVIHLYSCRVKGMKPGKQALDDEERIDLEWVPVKWLQGLIAGGEIRDCKTIAGLALAGLLH